MSYYWYCRSCNCQQTGCDRLYHFLSSHQLDKEGLVSFDVVSLFTNIPSDLAIQTAGKADDMLKDHTQLEVDRIIQPLELCLNATYLTGVLSTEARNLSIYLLKQDEDGTISASIHTHINTFSSHLTIPYLISYLL